MECVLWTQAHQRRLSCALDAVDAEEEGRRLCLVIPTISGGNGLEQKGYADVGLVVDDLRACHGGMQGAAVRDGWTAAALGAAPFD